MTAATASASRGAFAASCARALAALPAAQQAARAAQLATFLADGLPTRALEEWHYTDLGALAERAYTPARGAALDIAALRLPRTDRLSFANGHLDREASTADELCGEPADGDGAAVPTFADAIGSLNRALALPGLDFTLGADAQIARSLHVLFAGVPEDGAVMSHQRHRIVLGAGARATLILDFRGLGGSERLATHQFEVRLGAGAQLRLYRLEAESAGSTLFTRIAADVARDARLHLLSVDHGAGLARHDSLLTLSGAGAEVQVDSLFMPQSGAHLDNHLRITHGAPHGRSRQLCKGIVGERRRAILTGKVVVAPGAQKTDAEQRIASLLLGTRAEVDAKPELEIYADDVKCAHGASTGRLDAQALDYLRLRGLAPEFARTLLLQAFARDILERVDLPALRTELAARLGLPDEDPALAAFADRAESTPAATAAALES